MRSFPFPPRWIHTGLGAFRECDSTYCDYEYRSLPRLCDDEFDGTFEWLTRHPSPLEYDQRFSRGWTDEVRQSESRRCRDTSAALANAARELGISLPASVITFFSNIDLLTMIRSPTDCYFHRPRSIIPSPREERGWFVHILSDSQNCVEWYLYLDEHGKDWVAATWESLDAKHLPPGFWDSQHDHIVCCASSFESFIYRFWIECECCIRLIAQDQPLTEVMVDYLNASRRTKEYSDD